MEAPILTKHDIEAGGGGGGFTTNASGVATGVDTSVAASPPLMATLTATSSQAPANGHSATAGGGYTWNDTHFDQTEGIIAVFDFDYNTVSNRADAPRLRPQL